MIEFNKFEICDLRSLADAEKREEYKNLAQTIDLNKWEDYDCASLNVWSYRKSTDIRDGLNIKFGNMCNGFPFDISGLPFANSECAYIAGAYAGDDVESVRIQRLISNENNGQGCKRIYRNNPDFTKYMRKDFHNYNVEWMLYVIWQKCLGNQDFSNLMQRIPVDAHVVENTSLHSGKTATFWGGKNKELMDVRKAAEAKVEKNGGFRYKKDIELAKMLATNAINDIGHFQGVNCMGKIIKVCSLALIYNQEPPIDYNLLNEMNLSISGKRLEFPIKIVD